MTLTASQQQILKEYLNKELTYRETFEELYDHISSGLENSPESSSFDETLRNYVTSEFGGINGLNKIEKQYRATVLSGMKKQYLTKIYQQLRFPQLIIWVMITAVIYSTFSSEWFNMHWYFPLLLTMSLMVSTINTIRYIRTGYVWKSTKRSVKDEGFRLIKHAPAAILSVITIACYFFFKKLPFDWINNLNPLLPSFFFVAYALHVMSFYKMYAAEFKVDLAK